MAKWFPKVPQRWITIAGRDLGLGCVKQKFIFQQIAEHFGEPYLRNKQQGHELVARFLTERYPNWNARRRTSFARPAKKQVFAATPHAATDAFLTSYAWRRLRMEVLKERGPICECCGASAQRDRVRIHVDHIKPRRLFPQLALDKDNLQVLCESCNHGKGNWDQTDWREPDPSVMPMWHNPLRPRLVKKTEAK